MAFSVFWGAFVMLLSEAKLCSLTNLNLFASAIAKMCTEYPKLWYML